MSVGIEEASSGMVGGASRALRARRDVLLRNGDSPDAAAELQEIEAALQRIADGTWGHCERCHSAIGRDRLRAVPEARTCVSCSR